MLLESFIAEPLPPNVREYTDLTAEVVQRRVLALVDAHKYLWGTLVNKYKRPAFAFKACLSGVEVRVRKKSCATSLLCEPA